MSACTERERIVGRGRRELTPAQRAHCELCPVCTRELDALESTITTARTLGADAIDPARSERLRARILDAARRAPRTGPVRAPWIVAAGLGAAALVTLWFHLGSSDAAREASASAPARASSDAAPDAAPSMHGTVRASDGAHFTRLTDAPDEIVRLVDGSITVSVTPLSPGERFRVVVADAEVEVRGTAFEIAATDNHLTSVEVLHGQVEVRLDGHEPVLVASGERWTRALYEGARELQGESARVIDDALLAAQSPTVSPRTAHRRAGHAHEPPSSDAPYVHADDAPASAWSASSGFAAGWTALRSGDPARAADAFAEVVTRAPSDALAEDASFWRGVALARAGDPAAAQSALDTFVAAYPRSLRTGEASVMLGWLLLEHGDDAHRARDMFRRGEADASERVRASAERGLLAAAERDTRTSETDIAPEIP